jgi:hypothetical protein
MDEYTKELIESARATYKDVVASDDSRIQRGKVLWDQFEAAAEACRKDGKDSERQLGERINELAVARCSPITYTCTGRSPMSPTCYPVNGRSILLQTGCAITFMSR